MFSIHLNDPVSFDEEIYLLSWLPKMSNDKSTFSIILITNVNDFVLSNLNMMKSI